jgi:hypothetical protein
VVEGSYDATTWRAGMGTARRTISLCFSQFGVLLMIAGRRRRQDVLLLRMFREHFSNEIAFLIVQPFLLS